MDGLAAGTFHQVVNGTHDDQASGAPVQSPGKVQIIGMGNVLGVRQGAFGQQADERLAIVSSLITGGNFFGECGLLGFGLKIVGRRKIKCSQDAASDGNKVWGKLEGHHRTSS